MPIQTYRQEDKVRAMQRPDGYPFISNQTINNNETDPNGLKASDPGAKLDAGKVRYSLIPTGPLRWLAKLYTIGAKKYSDHGWKEVSDGENRYLDALIRHLEAYRDGEWFDKDTKVPHIIAVAWNAFAICWSRETKTQERIAS